MKQYKVKILPIAAKEIENLGDVIKFQYKVPETAFKYIQGLLDTIKNLENNASIFQIQTNTSLQQYGINVRRINYKKMAIIYTIHAKTVYIHRVLPQSMITKR